MEARDERRLLAQPTRARLFDVLEGLRRAATTDELAAALGMHANGVRRHLERMQQAGLVERCRVRHGRGRPRDEWAIAPGHPAGEPPRAYADVARWLARATPTGPAGLRRIERTGREAGRDLVEGPSDRVPDAFRHTFAALGFEPEVEAGPGGTMTAKLCNCPYRDSVRENPDVICTLHRGVTAGVLDTLDPGSRLIRFEPHDPAQAGCEVEVALTRGRDDA